MNHPTIRTLAASLGLSRATVAEALRGSPRFSAETIARVRDAARKAGYRRNPLVGAVMSEIRRSRQKQFRGVLAAIDLNRAIRPAANPYDRQLLEGARKRAAELGFKIETYAPGATVPVNRLNSVLHARGIQGVLLLPAVLDPDLSQLDWSQFSGIYTDYSIQRPALHTVCPDHSRAMIDTLARLERGGYRRVGLYVSPEIDLRIQYHWSGAFLGYRNMNPRLANIPPLLAERVTRADFGAWFGKFKPQVVLTHSTDVIDWMESCGARVPATHGFVCLNIINQDRPTAGLNLQPALIGARAVENLVAQVQRGEFGVPRHPSFVGIPAEWTPGPTLHDTAADAS